MNVMADLFLTFARIGLFTFGGGYAMIPLIQREAVERRHWISDEELLDVLAIAESTPGPIAINCATFIGRKTGGFAGALCATLGVVLPSFAILAAVTLTLQAFSRVRAVRYAFWGIRAGVLALILRALWKLFRQCRGGWFAYGVMALSLAASAFLGLSAILVIACCALLGILYTSVRRTKP